MHPHLNHHLAADRIRELTEQAARARFAASRRRVRRALLAALVPAALAAHAQGRLDSRHALARPELTETTQ
jgi:hypothetical protein